jgi:CubicO group peptidase (beta-lactamase class C family)
MKLKLVVSIIIWFLASRINAQEIGLFKDDSLDKYIGKALDEWKIPGVAVYIVKDNKVILQKGYGVSNWDTQSKVDEQTIFPIASISKTFTGTLFATLEAEGKVSLNDLVKKWLPDFSMKEKLYEQQITLTDILSHRSGWKTFQGDFINTESSLNYPTMIKKFAQMSPVYPIRTRFGYSNFGFIIAGECVQNITKQSFNTYLKNRFLTPLGMNRTFISEIEIKNEKNKALGHTLINDSITVLPPDKVEPFSHGGIFASISDLGIWVNTLLNKGNWEGKNVIPENAINKMWLSNTIIGKSRAGDREMYFKTYGLGWEIMQYQNKEVIQHNGAYSGALTSLTLVPSLQLGIVILTNQDNHNFQETLKWQVIDACLQKNAPNYTLTSIERQKQRKMENLNSNKEEKEEIEKFAVDLDTILGIYHCDYYGRADIKKENGNYILILEHHPQLKGVLTYFKNKELNCQYNHPMFGKVKFPFKVENNRVIGFTLFVDGFVEADGYEFRKTK